MTNLPTHTASIQRGFKAGTAYRCAELDGTVSEAAAGLMMHTLSQMIGCCGVCVCVRASVCVLAFARVCVPVCVLMCMCLHAFILYCPKQLAPRTMRLGCAHPSCCLPLCLFPSASPSVSPSASI